MKSKFFTLAFILASTISTAAFAGSGEIKLKAYTAYACKTEAFAMGTKYKLSIFPVDPDNSEQQAKDNAQTAQGLLSAESLANSIVVELQPVLKLAEDQSEGKIESINKKICEQLGYDKNDPNHSGSRNLKFQQVEIVVQMLNGTMVMKSIKIANNESLTY